MEDREITKNLRSAIEKIQAISKSNPTFKHEIRSGMEDLNKAIRQLNDCHVAVYEATQVTRDMDMILAHEIYMITKDFQITEGDGLNRTISKVILSIRTLAQDHLDYYA